VRFFVDGSGLFTLHVGDRIYEIRCEKGDLIGVPDSTLHWFDMGPEPRFVAIASSPSRTAGSATSPTAAWPSASRATSPAPPAERGNPAALKQADRHRHRRHDQLDLLRQGRAVPVCAPRPARLRARARRRAGVRRWLDAAASDAGGMCQDENAGRGDAGWIDRDRKLPR
jgi:1,2-dihydroxy-3-keto-5-methylthiopentene dioxygenase